MNRTLIEEARLRIAPIAQRTPVLTSLTFNTAAGVRTFFKCENLQKGGSFKIRGAANMILGLSPDDLARGIVAYSSGITTEQDAPAWRAAIATTCA